MPPTTCPSADVLRQLFLGRLGQEDLASIEGHVAACAACAETLSALNVSDTLLEPVKAQPAVAERMAPPRVTLAASVEAAVQGIVQGIVEHPQAMPERPAARSTLSASAGVERTTGLNGEADDAGENHDEDEDANYDFLAPPRAAGELGWLGPYRVLRVLGRGGMGMVFEAEDPQLRRHVALKVMKPGIAASSSARKRFLREAQAAAAVEHDHIVAIYQVGDERGVPFIAMPLLRGQTLAQRLRNAELQPLTPNAQRLTPNAQRLTLPLAELLRIAREVALGLAAAHERGLIHRDVKPANIWLEEKTGRVKLLDFGLARAAQAGEQLTQAGTLLGTPSYMAPEQAKGGPTDERADLFSLGCVLYQMASGQTPFAGRDALSILLAVTSQEPRPPRELNVELPAAVNDLIVALLSKEPAGRPQTAQEVVEHLRAIEADFVGQVSNLPSAEPTQRLSWDGLPRPSFSVGNALRGVPPGGVSPALTWHAAPFAARRVPRLPLLIAAAAGALLLAGIIIVIRNKDGSIARTVEVGPDQTATIEQHAASLPSADRGHGGEPSAVPAGKDGRRATSRADATDPMPGGAKAEPAAPLADSATLLADDPLPFVVLRPAGEPRRFKHFSAVLAVLRDGDEIEVHGNGPFKVPQVQLKNKGLVIRAAAGYRPRFVPAADVNGWFILDGGPLTVEGCDLEPGNRYFFLGGGAPWTIRNCRILKTNVGTIEYDGPKLSISDSYLCGTSIGVAGGAQVDLSGNIACMSNFILILGPKAGAGRKVRLTRNTFSRCGPVVTLQNGDPTGDGVEIEAVGNIFDCDTAVWDRRADGVKITWQGRDNLYGPNAMHLDAEGLRSPTDPVHMSPPQNL
ncbi:MAG TPA: serine/threonine-protein kinase, partial [Pirellulales bacterium]|nr:serine/threonine-protein kinase [Pirellulales bacterium]